MLARLLQAKMQDEAREASSDSGNVDFTSSSLSDDLRCAFVLRDGSYLCNPYLVER